VVILLCCGDRHWKDRELIAREIDKVRRSCRDGELITLVEGEADGADKLSRQWAVKVGIIVHPYPAKWKIYGFAAGPIRNQQMLDEEEIDLVLAFHDDLEHSSGTADMVRRAHLAEIPVKVITHQLPSE
jgi:hypothetical protein